MEALTNSKKPLTDLKLIDELLCDIKSHRRLMWAEVEFHSSTTREAMQRLRAAYASGEMPVITLSLAKYFGYR